MVVYKGFKIYYLTQGFYRVARGGSSFVGHYHDGIKGIMRDIDSVLAVFY